MNNQKSLTIATEKPETGTKKLYRVKISNEITEEVYIFPAWKIEIEQNNMTIYKDDYGVDALIQVFGAEDEIRYRKPDAEIQWRIKGNLCEIYIYRG